MRFSPHAFPSLQLIFQLLHLVASHDSAMITYFGDLLQAASFFSIIFIKLLN